MRNRPWNLLCMISVFGLVATFSACGGGQSGSGGSNVPDFTLAVAPSSVTLQSGTGGTVQVTLTPVNGFTGAAEVQAQNVPSGITLSATQFSVSAASAQTVTISTGPNVATGSYSLSFQGSSGSLLHSATLAVAVNGPAKPPSRADFVPTYDTPASGVYDIARKLIYVSNPTNGTVDVISSTTNNVLKSIPIPLPRGLDMSLDGSRVYVGTRTQALYVIDAATQEINQRYFAPAATGTEGFGYACEPLKPVETANGKLLLLATTDDGTLQIATWDLSTNTFEFRTSSAFHEFDITSVLARSGDGTKVIVADNTSAGTVVLYDSATDSFISKPYFGYPFALAANANGTQFAVASGQTLILDAQLNQVNAVPGSAPVKYSPDGSKLYLVGFLGSVPVVQTFDTQTFNLIGTAPSYASNVAYFERAPPLIQETPLATDETGRVFGSADHGLAIDDATDFHSYSGTEMYPVYNITVDPGEGTTNYAQNVQIETQAYTSAPIIWFGEFPATNTRIGTPYLAATTPAVSATGPVNVRLIDPDDVQSFIPQSYSYGSTLIPSPDLAASSAGGGFLNMFGYGLGVLGAQPTTAVNVGGSAAQVTKATPVAGEIPYPLSMSHIQFQPPPTSSGVYDIKVSSAVGSATLPGRYHSLAMATYPLDAQPYSIVYDSHRNQVYISTSDHVDVFSLTSATYLASISIPTINNIFQLDGMALSPDGSTLLVTNWADGSVAVVNPDNPSSAQVVAVVPPATSTGWGQGPNVAAVGNNGKALIGLASVPTSSVSSNRSKNRRGPVATMANGNGPAANLWELDLSTLTITPNLTIDYGAADTMSLKSTDDGAKICLAGEYLGISLYDSANGTFQQGPMQGGLTDCAVNGNAAAAIGIAGQLGLLDQALDYTGPVSLTDYTSTSMSDEASLTGLLVDPQGALLCQPFYHELILYDAHTGQILERIAMPTNVERISSGALAWDVTGLRIFVLTYSGLAVVRLDSLPLAIGHITALGSTWTVSGTGFVQGTSLSVGGTTLNTTFVNSQTLNVTGAPSLSSTEEVTLTNPNGRSYTIAAAFVR